MKKTYIMPLTAIVKITVQHVIATSPFNMNSSGEVETGTLQSGNATSTALGRSSSLWDDDEE